MKKYKGLGILFGIILLAGFCSNFGSSALDTIEPLTQLASNSETAPTQPNNLTSDDTTSSPDESETPKPELAPTTEAPPTPAEGSSFSITYFDVDQGDAALIECDGNYAMIDGGPPQASSKIFSYLKNNDIKNLDYMFASHSDTDHVGGLSGALQVASVRRAFSPVINAEEKAFNSLKSILNNQGKTLEIPERGATLPLGSARISIIEPGLTAYNDNDSSLILRIEYGATSFVFTGDASASVEQALANAGSLKECDVLKIPHHGSSDASSYVFLRELMPKHSVISLGKYNTYGHPHDEVLSRLKNLGNKVYRTDLQGDIVAKSDGKTVTVTVEKNAGADTLAPQASKAATPPPAPKTTTPPPGAKETPANEATVQQSYIGNKKSKKFHDPYCRSLPAPHNQVQLSNREAALNAGYDPCGNCNP